MNVKNNRRFQNSVRKIEDTFVKLLDEKNFEDIKVQEICNLADVNKSTFYVHYQNIDDLLLKVGQKKYALISERCRQNSTENEIFFVQEKYIVPLLEALKKDKVFYRAVFKRFHFLGDQVINGFKKAHTYYFNQNGIYDEIEIRYYITYYMNGFLSLVREWMLQDCKTPIDQMTQIIITCIVSQKRE